MKPLQGKRILITRTKAQSHELKALLEAEGAEVLAIPAIEIIPPDSWASLDQALHELVSYDWLVLTSANAVRALSTRAKEINIPITQLSSISIAAIGEATADAITALGLAIKLMPPQAVAESLAEALAPHVADKHVLLVRAKIARDHLPQTLIAAGANVTIAEAYQTVIPPSSSEQLRTAFTTPIDAITFTSASSVTNFLALVQAAQVALPIHLKIISIGPITTQALQQNGWTVDAEAQTPTMKNVCAAVTQAMQTERGPI